MKKRFEQDGRLPGKRFSQVQFLLPGKTSRERNSPGSKKSSREDLRKTLEIFKKKFRKI